MAQASAYRRRSATAFPTRRGKRTKCCPVCRRPLVQLKDGRWVCPSPMCPCDRQESFR
jgi:uncharacterized Zn finger protein (UPF0148 family)